VSNFPRLLIPPTGEPVTLVEAKRQVRKEFDPGDDSSLIGYLTSARTTLEKQFGMALAAQTWQATQDRFPHSGGFFGFPVATDYGGYWNRSIPRRRDEEHGWLDRVTIRIGKPPFLLLNALNYLDMSGTPQMVETIVPAGIPSAGTQIVTPFDMTGIDAGTQYSIADPAAPENVTVTATTATTFTATFASAHPVNTVVSALIQGAPPGQRFLNVDGIGGIGRIAPCFGQIWPFVIRQLGSVKLTWTAGYGPATTVAAPISPGAQTVTPNSMAGIYSGSVFWADPSTGRAEQVAVTATTATTFTATFAKYHQPGAQINAVPESIRQAILLLVGHWFINRESVGTVGKAVEDGVEALMAGERFAEYR
jgi:hypothetical protein